MCRSIKTLRRPEQAPTPQEIQAAALQFVRKISGYQKPSAANSFAFNGAVAEIAKASEKLLESLVEAQSRTHSNKISRPISE